MREALLITLMIRRVLKDDALRDSAAAFDQFLKSLSQREQAIYLTRFDRLAGLGTMIGPGAPEHPPAAQAFVDALYTVIEMRPTHA